MKWFLASFLIVFALLLPATASADDGKEDRGLTLRVTGDVTVAKGDTVGAVVVIDGTATIDGTVTDSLTVINGTAIVTGTVRSDLTVIAGTLDLRTGAQVQDVNLIDSDLVRADGVIVTGAIESRDGFEIPSGVLAALSIYFWIAMTLTVVVAGLAFAAIGSRQLNEATRVMTGEPSNSFIGGVFLWVVLPIVAVLAMLTLIGIPLGLGVLVVVLPTMWFLGLIVAGARLGTFILHRDDAATRRPLAATTLGLVLLQLSLIIPVVGGLIVMLAGAWGAGALTFMAYRAAGGKGFSPAAPQPPVPSTPSLAM
jgi:cytoskeletal protein CcmA (bactofilin family)